MYTRVRSGAACDLHGRTERQSSTEACIAASSRVVATLKRHMHVLAVRLFETYAHLKWSVLFLPIKSMQFPDHLHHHRGPSSTGSRRAHAKVKTIITMFPKTRSACMVVKFLWADSATQSCGGAAEYVCGEGCVLRSAAKGPGSLEVVVLAAVAEGVVRSMRSCNERLTQVLTWAPGG